LFDRIEKTVEIGEVGNIAANSSGVAAEFFLRRIKFGLAATRDKDMRAFRREPFGGGESNTAAAARN
jgi:hypothetical protein